MNMMPTTPSQNTGDVVHDDDDDDENDDGSGGDDEDDECGDNDDYYNVTRARGQGKGDIMYSGSVDTLLCNTYRNITDTSLLTVFQAFQVIYTFLGTIVGIA